MAARTPRKPRKPRARRRSPKVEKRDGAVITTYDGGIRGFTSDLGRCPEAVVDEVAYEIDRIAVRQANKDRMPFRNRGEGPHAKIVKRGGGESAYVTLIGTPAGIWTWMEDGVKDHPVTSGPFPGPRSKRRRRRRGRGSSGARARASFLPAKRSWTKVNDKGRKVVDQAMLAAFDSVMR